MVFRVFVMAASESVRFRRLPLSKTLRIPVGLTLPVAVMQPTPPPRNVSSKKTSEPAKVPNPGKASRIAFVFDQSPPLSFADNRIRVLP